MNKKEHAEYRKSQQSWRHANKDKVKANQSHFLKTHPTYMQDYYQEHKAAIQAYQHKYYQAQKRARMAMQRLLVK
jgi:hypothetical protein